MAVLGCQVLKLVDISEEFAGSSRSGTERGGVVYPGYLVANEVEMRVRRRRKESEKETRAWVSACQA